MNLNETMKFDNRDPERTKEVRQILSDVYKSLTVKGYNPVSQLVGYIISGDPTYITSYNNARGMIGRIERDELLEEIVTQYIKTSM